MIIVRILIWINFQNEFRRKIGKVFQNKKKFEFEPKQYYNNTKTYY